jgi:hypothetical protein
LELRDGILASKDDAFGVEWAIARDIHDMSTGHVAAYCGGTAFTKVV